LWLVLAFVTVCGVLPAAAQTTTTINQTSCINGTGSCLTDGVLQEIAVNCSAGGKISTALASIADREGPNTINVSGTCNESLSINGFNRLAIQGGTITKGVTVQNSGLITFRGQTFDFGGAAMNLNVLEGRVLLDGVTIKNSAVYGLGVSALGVVNFGGIPSVITGNGGNGIFVNGGHVALTNTTVSNNGGSQDGDNRDGIQVVNGGVLVITNVANGADGPVDISGNQGLGIHLDSSTLQVNAQDHPNALVHIHGNDSGIDAIASSMEVTGHFKVDGNGSGNCVPFAAACQIGSYNSTAQFTGAQILGGVLSAFHSVTVFEDDDGTDAITGAATFIGGATGLLFGTNAIDTLTCDNASWITTDHNSTVGSSTCPEDAPRVSAGATGPKGDKGDKGDPGAQGPSGTGIVGREVVTTSSAFTVAPGATRTVTATCPASKGAVGGGATSSNPRLVVVGSSPEGITAWKAVFANIGSVPQAGTLAAQVICVVTPLPLAITNLAASPSGPIALGSAVTFTATVSGGTAPYTYEFWVNHGSGWTLGRTWSADNTWMFTPSAPGAYNVQVWVRNAGSTATQDAWRGGAITVLPPAPLSVTSLMRSPSGALKAGLPVTITAAATGGTGPYTYEFWFYNGTAWTLGQAWSAGNTWQFTPGAGTYTVQVWVRNAGSTATYDAWKGLGPFTIVP
jgi:hypothetical protein